MRDHAAPVRSPREGLGAVTARHCFAEEQHLGHVWLTFGIGNAGAWECDGTPVMVLQQDTDGTWRWGSR